MLSIDLISEAVQAALQFRADPDGFGVVYKSRHPDEEETFPFIPIKGQLCVAVSCWSK